MLNVFRDQLENDVSTLWIFPAQPVDFSICHAHAHTQIDRHTHTHTHIYIYIKHDPKTRS